MGTVDRCCCRGRRIQHAFKYPTSTCIEKTQKKKRKKIFCVCCCFQSVSPPPPSASLNIWYSRLSDFLQQHATSLHFQSHVYCKVGGGCGDESHRRSEFSTLLCGKFTTRKSLSFETSDVRTSASGRTASAAAQEWCCWAFSESATSDASNISVSVPAAVSAPVWFLRADAAAAAEEEGCRGGSSADIALSPFRCRCTLARELLRTARRTAATTFPLASLPPSAPPPPDVTPRGLRLLRLRVETTVVAVSDVKSEDCDTSSEEHVAALDSRWEDLDLPRGGRTSDDRFDRDLARLRNSRAQQRHRYTSNCPSTTLCAVHMPQPKHCTRGREEKKKGAGGKKRRKGGHTNVRRRMCEKEEIKGDERKRRRRGRGIERLIAQGAGGCVGPLFGGWCWRVLQNSLGVWVFFFPTVFSPRGIFFSFITCSM